MKCWSMIFVITTVCQFGFGGTRDREWADAMLKVRAEYRKYILAGKNTGKKKKNKPDRRGVIRIPEAERVEKLLEKFPYRTDWFLQDSGNDITAWLKQTSAPEVEKKILKKLQEQAKNFPPSSRLRRVIHGLEKHFQALEKAGVTTDDPRWLVFYAQVCAVRRVQRLEKLKAAFPKIVFTKNHTIMPSFFAYTEGQSDAQRERHFIPGSALCVAEWDGAYLKTKDLIRDPFGRIHFLDDYHLYELDTETGRIRQLTFGLGVADFEPCYVPSGDIVFSSTRCVQTVDCWWTEVSNLYTCDKDGNYLRRLGFDQVHTVKPALLEDGRVIYTRWDYNDRGQIFPQGLFQMNFDGTGQTEFYGNNSWFPTAISHARGIPGSSLVIAIAHGHHTWQAGKLILIDVSKGRQEAQGVQLIAPIRKTEPVKVDKYGQEGDLFQYPYPMNEREYLVAYSPLGGRPTRFSIYYMDIDGHRELLIRDPSISCQHPVPLIPRKRPPVRASSVDYTKKTGTYYVQDIYFGPGLKGICRGSIRKLRVVALEFRAAGIGRNGNRGPAGGALVCTPVSIGNGTWDVKRIIGDAKVYTDGSAFFEAPANTPLYFQALDKYGRAVQTMRSWTTLMPGENFSCLGCHEDKNSAPPLKKTTMAMRAGAQKLEPFYGKPRGFSFLKEIQPILDAKCVKCHNGKTINRSGKPIFSLKNTPVEDKRSKRRWTESYIALTQAEGANNKNTALRGKADRGYCVWISAQSVPEMIPPRSVGSTVSPLIDRLLDGHGNLTLDEIKKMAAWIDLGVPFCGDYCEAALWSTEEKAFYDRYQKKRERLAELERRNIEALLAGRPLVQSLMERNPYRNIAPEATITASSAYRNLPHYLPGNVIDGNRANKGHGKDFPSWGPDKTGDQWLKLEWGKDMFVDRVNIYIRADFRPYTSKDHDSWWKRGVIELSSGRRVPFKLEKTADAQVIEIKIKKWPPEPVRWLKFTNLVPAENKWCGFSEVEVMGCFAVD